MIINIPIFNSKTFPIDAITICFIVFVWVKNPSLRLIKHEMKHVEQWKESPILFYPRYFLEFLVNLTVCDNPYEAYRAISYEKEARKAALE